MRIEDLLTIAVPEQPALAPDSTAIAYVLRTADPGADRTARGIWRVGTHRGEPHRLTRGPGDTHPAWSPDGDRLAFLRTPAGGPAQLWMLPSAGGEPDQLTALPLGAGPAAWSPDGTRIAFTAPVDLLGDPATAPVATARLDYRSDGTGLHRGRRRHVHVLDVATGRCRRVTDGDWHAGEPAWSPDSAWLAFPAATAPDADVRYRAPVYVLDVTDDTAAPAVAGLADGVGGPLAWPAGDDALLVVGHAGAPVGHAALLRVPLDGGPVTDLTAGLDRNVMPGGPAYPGARPQLADQGRTVLFCVRDRGCTHLYAVPAAGGTPRPVLTGDGRVVSGLSVAGDTAATVLATPDSYGEVVAVDLATGAATVRSGHDPGGAARFRRTPRDFPVSDGAVVPGWVIRDPAATGAQPLLLDIHGGPHNAWHGAADDVHLYQQELAARGWTVLLLNPRGSDGYGEASFTATAGAWGEADARDLLEPVDRLVADGLADPDRLAVTGYSYGGYLTCYLTSRDDRFAAAVAGGVVADLTSFTGTSDEGHNLAGYELGGHPWTHPDRYAAMSPLTAVDRVRTPTLIVQGDADLTCPVGQAQQWHAALRARHVPTELVLYPGGDHLTVIDGPPSHRLDWNRRVAGWVQRYAGDATGPRPRPLDAAHWQRRLAALAARHRVPGAALGVLRLHPGADDERIEVAHGVLNTVTGVAATADSLFQIGSQTKVWTTTLVRQLVEEGRLDLDAPLLEVLPELRLADDDATRRVTMWHLLTHTSGLDGDVFTDTGRGDDALERYVAGLAEAGQNHPLGATWSYCNCGFVLAGRVIEKLTGGTWDEAVRTRLVRPLGLRHTVTLPEEALLHRVAVGHVPGPDGQPVRAPVAMLPRSIGPAGLIASTVGDVLTFARPHLAGGLAADGTRILGADGVAEMAARQVDLPEPDTLGDSWGLGWNRRRWGGHRLIGHDGTTIGQSAYLWLLPAAGLAVTLLANGENTRDLYHDLYREVFAEVAGVTMPAPLAPPADPVPVDATAHLGRYERAGHRIDVTDDVGGLRLRLEVTGPLAELAPEKVRTMALTPVAENRFVVRLPHSRTWVPVLFLTLPGGAKYLRFGARVTPKVA
ncbi:serine hydrolase [Jidongwangia harbinensis]|uniref:serine hydrolase n=1 Tax=Jidongwangia harbinensis TaxID=2878561 RepID=UPI001CD9FAD7|nr:serine hydrolase [Jidongwangia harbinensis]MCA2214219.1 serine hydrolase [Jidongwangia harbinensis]